MGVIFDLHNKQQLAVDIVYDQAEAGFAYRRDISQRRRGCVSSYPWTTEVAPRLITTGTAGTTVTIETDDLAE